MVSQIQASESAKFWDDYGLKHEPSSRKYPQDNGKIKRQNLNSEVATSKAK